MASVENVTGDFATILERAKPTFKTNYMEMSRHTDAATFDRELTERMPLANQVAGIPCPVLVGIGEFDELTPLWVASPLRSSAVVRNGLSACWPVS